MPAPIHLRTQIRDALTTAVTGLATTAGRVHKSYTPPLDAADLPCLCIRTDGAEQIDGATVGVSQERALPITVSGYVKAAGDIDATLNQIALEVETALAAVPTLSGKCTRIELSGIDSGIDQSLEKPVGRVDINYRITYFTAAGAPGTLI